MRSLFEIGEVPPFPTVLAETQTEDRESRMPFMMASNVQGLTENLAEATREYTVMLEQMLNRARGELAFIDQQLAEANEKLEAQEEQILRMEAISEGTLHGC